MVGLVVLGLNACEPKSLEDENRIGIGGSSAVLPLAEAAARRFHSSNPTANIPVRASDTRTGLKRLCEGDLDIAMASRTLKPSEAMQCGKSRIKFFEIPVALDGIAIVVNRKNRWLDHLTKAELARLWQPGGEGRVTRWSQIREEFPEEEFALFGPENESSTFETFTKKVSGKRGASRTDYTASDEDFRLVSGIEAASNGLGYLRLASYTANQKVLRLVPLKDGDGPPVSPSVATIRDGSYSLLSRTLYLYVAEEASERPMVDSFIKHWLGQARAISDEEGYVPLPVALAKAAGERYLARETGSID